MPTDDAVHAIHTLLNAQASAWNRGDLIAFMQAYWKDPRLRYSNGTEIVLGWDSLLNGYRTRYGDHASLRKACFSDIVVELLAADVAVAFGRYSLDQPSSHGTYALLLKKLPEGWRIISDQTSSAR